jgi:hypothetical protein
MKSVYVGRKPCTCIAVAVDFSGLDGKTVGKLLQLIVESNLVIDRVEREEVMFFETCPHIPDRKDDHQMPIDFNKPATEEAGVGPSEMGEGFTCTFSGPCPHENKSCATCEYVGSAIPKATVLEDTAETVEESALIADVTVADWQPENPAETVEVLQDTTVQSAF